MATAALIPVAEYLATSYRPDRDYVDGEVRERNLGEKPHSALQTFLASIFLNNEQVWQLDAFVEWRVQVAPTRFRIPDLCVLPAGPTGPILRTPPLLCVEILSPGDSLGDMQERIDDYLHFGVEHIWLIDPVRRLAWTADAAGLHPVRPDGTFVIEGTRVSISVALLYARLDKIAAGL